jgi:hypothetical protein
MRNRAEMEYRAECGKRSGMQRVESGERRAEGGEWRSESGYKKRGERIYLS